jgi:hypothetical protein
MPILASAWSSEGYVPKSTLDQLEQGGTKNVYTYWYKIVRDYSGRQLTKPIDKFPALSGLALVFGGILKDTYLAGLWKNELCMGFVLEELPTLVLLTDYQLLLIAGLDPNVMAASTWMFHHHLADPQLMLKVRDELDKFV